MGENAEFAKLYGKNDFYFFFTHGNVKKEKEICASFSVALQTVKVLARLRSKME